MIDRGRHRRGTRAYLVTLLLLGLAWGTDALAQEVNGPRDMLQVMQIDASQLRFLLDDRPLVAEEQETLLQLLFRLPQFSQLDLDRWSQPAPDWTIAWRDPDSYRFELWNLRGRLTQIQERIVLPEMARRVGFPRYYELTIQHDQIVSTVFVQHLPETWKRVGYTGDPATTIGLQALLLKRLPTDNAAKFVFVAPRISWYPETTAGPWNVSEDQLQLARWGLDLSRLEDVEQRAELSGQDRECFYQMLAATRQASLPDLRRQGRRDFDIAELIRTPEQVIGELYALEGLARRILKIQVPDPDIRERFGIEHYYEVEVFLPLPRAVRFQDDAQDPGKLFTEYPFVLALADLPAGVEVGDDVRQPIRFAGYFLKLWAYRSQFMSGDAPATASAQLQLSPLLIGPTLAPRRTERPDGSGITLTLAVLFSGGLVVLWIVMWRVHRADRFRSQELKRKRGLDEDVAFGPESEETE